MKTGRIIPTVLITTLALALVPSLIMAQDQSDQQSQPSNSVARVSLINGEVSTQRGDSGDWVSTTVNAPLVPGDRISTGARSRAEVQLDFANVLRLDQNSEAKIADLTRSRIQVQLAQGNMDLSAFKGGQADVEIDTPNVAVQPSGDGVYRIQVNGDQTQVIIRQGTAQISTPQGSTNVKAGDMITIEGTDNPQYQVSNAPGQDDWDEWNSNRDNSILNAQSYSHTNRYYTGAQDLDRNGRWVYVPNYDYVWQPNVGADWAPYRDGRWVWEPGWGWTWVSYEDWGWAPYHYGRWFYYGNSWCWWPGYVTPAYYPVWAPAYVSFIGFGWGHFSFGFGFGSIGWLALGPHDYCHPWWGHGASFNQVNITNITNVTTVNNYRGGPAISNFSGAFTNGHVRGAVTTVSTQDFVNGRVPRHVGTMTVAQLRQGKVIQGTVPAVPTRQSLSPGRGPARVPAVAQSGAGQRTFFTRNQPPATGRSFEQHAAQIQQQVQQPKAPVAVRPGASTQAAANSGFRGSAGAPSRPMTANSAAAATSGNARFGQTGRAPSESAQTSRPGWTRFGGSAAPTSTTGANVTRGSAAPSVGGARAQAAPQQAPGTSGRQAASPGWRRFGDSNSQPATAPRQSAPRANQPATNAAPRTSEPRSAPATRNDNPSRSSNWQGFTRQAPSESRVAPAREPAQAQPGWSRFSGGQSAPRGNQSPSYGSQSRGNSRPPLDIRKPIVQERAPQSYGSPNRGSWGSPSRPSYSAPSRPSYSAPSRPSYSSPSPSRGSWGGGGSSSRSSGSWGGGGRSSGGGGGRSAPAPSRSSGGGGRRH